MNKKYEIPEGDLQVKKLFKAYVNNYPESLDELKKYIPDLEVPISLLIDQVIMKDYLIYEAKGEK